MVDTINKDNTAHIDNEPQGNAAVMMDDPRDRNIGNIDVGAGVSVWDLLADAEGDDEVYEYDQNVDPLKMFCTVMGPTGLISSYWNRKQLHADHVALFNYAKRGYGYRQNVGHYTNTGVRCAISHWVTKHNDEKMYYFSQEITGPAVKKALEKGLGVVLTYQGNNAYSADRNVDGIVNKVSFGKATYGHCLRADRLVTYKGIECVRVRDSYNKRNMNTYYIPYANLGALVKNGVFYPRGYLILPAKPILQAAKLPQEIFEFVMTMKSVNSSIWNRIEKLQHEHAINKDHEKFLDDLQSLYHKINNRIRAETD